MNAETFFKHFETFAEAPNGVAKLREMILQLAVLGKLVSQDPDDEPAQVAVDRANTTRLSNGAPKATHRSCFSGSNNDPKNSDLPRGWANMVLDSVCSQVTDGEHLTPQREFHGEIPLVTAKNVRDGFIDLTTTDFVSRETAEKCWKRCCPIDNDILMVCVGATTGRLTVLVTPSPSVIVRSVALFRPIQDLLVSEYLAIVLRSPVGQSQIWSSVKQSAQPCLYISKSKRIPVALPPRAEQKRIVSKVDQLMKLCDELDSRQTARRESRMRLVGATLDRVVSTSSTAEFPKHVNRLRDQFDRLFDTPTTIPQLRQTILQLAVQGKLVPQDPNDEPVPSGIFNINQLGGGPDRKVFLKAVSNILVPATWALAPLAAVSEAIVDCPHSTPKWTTTGRMCVRTNQFRAGSLDLTDVRFVNDATFLERIQRLRARAKIN